MEKREIDRSGWPAGEWDSEPDRVDFVHAGFACFMLRNPMGAFCGYVGVPSNHPAYGKHYDDVPVDAHGGLTYAEKCQGAICHIPEPGMPDDVWWLGFDCAHHMDVVPSMERFGYESRGEIYRNVAYVTNEIKSLAEQLAAMKES